MWCIALNAVFLEEGIKVTSPVICSYDDCPILSTYKLGMIHLSRLLHDSNNVVKTAQPTLVTLSSEGQNTNQEQMWYAKLVKMRQ